MTKQTTIMLGLLFAVTLICVTLVILFDKEPDTLITLIGVNLIPAILTIWAGNRADKAVQAVGKVEEQVNGHMGTMIQATITNGNAVDVDKYADVIERQNIDVPEEQAITNTTEPSFTEFDVTKREGI